MTDAEKSEASVEVSQDLTQPTIAALTEINEGLKKKLEVAEGRLASPELKSALVDFKSEVQKFSEGLCGTIDKLLARIEDPKGGAICGKDLQKMIQSGSFGYVNVNITEANFPDVGVKTDFKVFYPNKVVSSDQMVAEMKKEGYRPANLRELLTWMSANWNGKDWVVALGQEWRDSGGGRDVPCLCFGGERGLDLGWDDGGWDAGCRFLAVRNS
ncbi:MAG: hypothetical protein G01um101419_142 [Parcubacteria group bacterium Gr01-1014_19]|nr:MAG: hypothetical protein G01um101419_142 [Parcubacteria group bacterium Gr01-1014_19]